MPRILILIPTYNERDNVIPLAEEILSVVPEADILFIDDASPDGTGDLLNKISEETSNVSVRHRPGKKGLGAAYMDGFRWSLKNGYDVTICMDADFSHSPKDLPRMLQELEHTDLAAGSRYMPGGGIRNWSLHRRILSRGAAVYARALTRMPFTDPTGGFNGYRNDMLNRLPINQINSLGYSFQIEMKHLAWTSGYRTTEIPIIFTERRQGVSKMSTGIIREAFQLVAHLHRVSKQKHKST